MDEDIPPTDEEAQSPPPNKEQPGLSHAQESDSDSSCPDALKKYENILPLTERKLASIEGYYDKNVDHRDQTDKLVQETMDCLEKNSTKRVDLLKALNGVTQTLKVVLEAIKDDPPLNRKATAISQDQHLATWAKSSTFMAWNVGPRLTAIKSSQAEIKSEISSLKSDTLEIKSMMTEIYQAFKGEHETIGDDTKKAKSDKAEEEPTRAVPISTIKPITRPNPEVALIESSSRPSLTDPILEIHVPQQTALVTQREGNDQEVIKVVQEEAEKIRLDPKTIVSTQACEKFKKAHDAEHQVLKREHSQKVKRLIKLNKKKAEQYTWTISNRLKPEPITDVRIHPNSKPVVLTVFKNNDKRNFQVHRPFKFFDFRVTRLDELGLIIQKKKNTIVKDLMIFLGKRYVRLKKIPKELGIQSTLPAPIPEQAPS
ncbi:hypothetical protein Tco_1275486 [Tanacetum coccineum]